MAKQNSATDPVSAAMSAIESALNLTDDDEAGVASDDHASPPPLAPAKPTTATPVLKPSQLAGDAPTLFRGRASGVQEDRSKASDFRAHAGKRRSRDRRRDPASDERAARRPDAIRPRLHRFASVGDDLLRLRLRLSVALGFEETSGDAVPTRDAAVPVGGACTDLLHVCLRGSFAPIARVSAVGARDLGGRGASCRTRDDGWRACSEPLPGYPSRTHVDGGRRRAGACAGCGARDTRAVRGFDPRALLFRQRAQDPSAHRGNG